MTVTVTTLYVTGFYADKGVKKIIGVFKLDFSNTYSAGGDTLDLSAYFKKVDCILPVPNNGYIFEPDLNSLNTPNAIKIKVIQPTKSQEGNLAGNVTIAEYSATYAEAGTYDVNFTGTKGNVDAGPGEELADGVTYPEGLSCIVLVFGS